MGVAEAKRAALETVETVRKFDGSLTVLHWPKGDGYATNPDMLYAGTPFLARPLDRPSEHDL